MVETFSKRVEMNIDRQKLIDVKSILNMMISRATGGSPNDLEYFLVRQSMICDSEIKDILPDMVHTCRDLSQFWSYIKQIDQYEPRREHIKKEFRKVLSYLEGKLDSTPLNLEKQLDKFGSSVIKSEWDKALLRKLDDPEGSITIAKTMLESVCKHILERTGTDYNGKEDLPKLYNKCSRSLNLLPDQYTENEFKKILGGCISVTNGLAAIRNKLSDAHGRGSKPVKPQARHAELAVNLAGSMALFLMSTWEKNFSS